jgi:hypothetical protein
MEQIEQIASQACFDINHQVTSFNSLGKRKC